jgi:hypothetical protein
MQASSGALKALYEIVILLASDQGDIADRLGNVYFSRLKDIDLSAFPPPIRSRLQSICAELHELYPELGKIGEVDIHRASDLAQHLMILYDAMVSKRT